MFGIKDLFTTINLLGGIVAICLCIDGHPYAAGVSVMIGYLCGDTLDGYIANDAPSPQDTEAYYWEGAWEHYDHLQLGVRISGDAVAAVPEPAAWALMLTGFLGAGAALRTTRRRQAALAA